MGCLLVFYWFWYVVFALDFVGFFFKYLLYPEKVSNTTFWFLWFCFFYTLSPLLYFGRGFILDLFAGSVESDTPPILNMKDNIMVDNKLPTTNVPGVPTFNLSELNLLELDRELRNSLKSNSSSFIFMRERENKKLELQKDKVNIILQTIRDLNLTQKELTNFQADTFLSNELLEQIIAEKREEIRNLAAIKKKKFLIEHKTLDDQLLQIDHVKEARETVLQAAKLANLKTQQEINIMMANSEEAKAKAQLIMYVLKELDLKNMPQTLQTYLITSIVNPQGSQYQDFDMQEQLKKFVIKEADAKARQSLANASIVETQADVSKATGELTRTDISIVKSNRDSLKSH